MSLIKPFAVLNIDLSIAQTVGYVVQGENPLIRVLNARRDGALVSDVIVEAQAEDNQSRFDLGLGQAAIVRGVKRWTLRWAAQAGVMLQIGFSSDPSQTDWDMDPPTQLVVTGEDPLSVDLDEGRDKTTRDNVAFHGGAQLAASPGNLALWQLRNGGASGFLYLDKVLVAAASAMDITVRTHGTAITTATTSFSNDVGGAAGNGVVRSESSGSGAGTFYGIQQPLAANAPVEIVFDHPIRIGPGEGILIQAGTVNIALATTFFWREKTS